jgi:hypothetical protein
MVKLDGRCDYAKGQGTNVLECDFDGGDCNKFNEDYPDCKVSYFEFEKLGGE